MERTYVCIDLKSFYASVECVDRGLDPLTANLVVADPDRTEKTICLAITPSMKALGLSSRCRVFEIPESVDYVMAKPRMQRYMEASADIYSIYLRFVSPEDVHPYSIDECFIDATPYLSLYRTSAREFAVMLMEAVLAETGVRATAGVGPNLFLAKVALTPRTASAFSTRPSSSALSRPTGPSPISGTSARASRGAWRSTRCTTCAAYAR